MSSSLHQGCSQSVWMFFATGGRGTESFLAQEIKHKLQAQISEVWDGKVFFTLPADCDSKTLHSIKSLKTAERVFLKLADYDNSEFRGKRSFLDRFMTVIRQPEVYTAAKSVLGQLKINSRNHESICETPAEDSELMEGGPQAKYARRDDANQTEAFSDAASDNLTSSAATTFRLSIKCSGKLRQRLDLKRLSLDSSWRVAQASGWRANPRRADVEMCVHIGDSNVTIGVPLSKSPLSKRTYIQDPGLRAPVASIMCQLAEINPGDVVLDPMCGKATILLEGTSEWGAAHFIGSDTCRSQVVAAALNVHQAQSTRGVDLALADSLAMPYRSCCVDSVLCDVPFNQKHFITIPAKLFYKQFLQEVSRVLRPGGRCVLLMSEALGREILELDGVIRVSEAERGQMARDRDGTGFTPTEISETVDPSLKSSMKSVNDVINENNSMQLEHSDIIHPKQKSSMCEMDNSETNYIKPMASTPILNSPDQMWKEDTYCTNQLTVSPHQNGDDQREKLSIVDCENISTAEAEVGSRGDGEVKPNQQTKDCIHTEPSFDVHSNEHPLRVQSSIDVIDKSDPLSGDINTKQPRSLVIDTGNMSDPFSYDINTKQPRSPVIGTGNLLLTSRFPIKLGETLACIFKLIKT